MLNPDVINVVESVVIISAIIIASFHAALAVLSIVAGFVSWVNGDTLKEVPVSEDAYDGFLYEEGGYLYYEEGYYSPEGYWYYYDNGYYSPEGQWHSYDDVVGVDY